MNPNPALRAITGVAGRLALAGRACPLCGLPESGGHGPDRDAAGFLQALGFLIHPIPVRRAPALPDPQEILHAQA